jgi:hypothetical protein
MKKHHIGRKSNDKNLTAAFHFKFQHIETFFSVMAQVLKK